MYKIARLLALILILTPMMGLGNDHGNAFSCGESNEFAVSQKCRLKTLANTDASLIDHVQSLLKFDQSKYDTDEDYQRGIDHSIATLGRNMTADMIVEDYRQYFLPIDDSDLSNSQGVTDMLASLEVQHAGCNFTLDTVNDLNLSRSFIVAFLEDDVQRFAAFHVHLAQPKMAHQIVEEDRRIGITAIKIYPLVLGFPNSDAVLRDHILPNPSVKCERILDLLDQDKLDALRG